MEVIFELATGERRAFPFEEGNNVMRIAVLNDVPGITGDCGGSSACGTCHIYVDNAWLGKVGTPDPDSAEACMIEVSPADAQPNSRLGCQIVLTAALDGLVVHIPEGQ